MVQGTQSVRADDDPETRPIIGDEGSTLRLTTTERRLAAHFSRKSAAHRLHRRLEKILPIEFPHCAALMAELDELRGGE
jgi:hypothetical protein